MPDNHFEETIPLEAARSRLGLIWFIGSAFLFFMVVAQSIGTTYQGQLQEAWSAFLPMILPTLSLIVSVLGGGAIESHGESEKEKKPNQITVKRGFFKISCWLSIVYLLLIFLSIIGQPAFVYFQSNRNLQSDKVLAELQTTDQVKQEPAKPVVKPVNLLKVSNLWLAPFQGLVVAAMGVLFMKKEQKK